MCSLHPSPQYGQEVAAAVVLKASAKGKSQKDVEKELQAYCSGKMSAFKVPKRIYTGDSLPRTATGKIQRRFVAEAFAGKDKGRDGGKEAGSKTKKEERKLPSKL